MGYILREVGAVLGVSLLGPHKNLITFSSSHPTAQDILDAIDQLSTVSKSNWLHVDIFWFSFIN